MRLLEVPACKTCLLTDYVRDAELLLVPGKEFVSAKTLAEMQRRLAELLADEVKRSRIAQRGYEKASRIRTYDALVAQIVSDYSAIHGAGG